MSSDPSSALHSYSRQRGILLAIGAFVLTGLSAFLWQFWPAATVPAPPDPRLHYSGPFENIHPSVKYVGDASCMDCHFDIAGTYSEHPMGRSTVPISELADRQKYSEAVRNPFKAFGWDFRVERQGDQVWHDHQLNLQGEPFARFRQPVHFAVGSGSRGHSYLTVVDGFVFQTAISWFSQNEHWDISPGFRLIHNPGRPIQPECLRCHSNAVKPIRGSFNRYEPGVFAGSTIGCERCHGPGEKHVAAREQELPVTGDFDTTIVNPRRLDWRVRENVCEQCHVSGLARVLPRGRQPDDYRPGLPLEAFNRLFVVDPALPDLNKAVSHVEQMYRSRCFQGTPDSNKLGCISCHDPHFKPAPTERIAYFRQRCQACHENKPCSEAVAVRLKKQPDDSCIACHMPRRPAGDIAHTALTDHTIQRRPSEPSGSQPSMRLTPDQMVLLHPDRVDQDDLEQKRDRGIALMLLRGPRVALEADKDLIRQAIELLQPALKRSPDDAAGWYALAQALLANDRFDEADRAIEQALKREPDHEGMLHVLLRIREAQRRWPEAIEIGRRIVALNPYQIVFRQALGSLLARQRDWPAAQEQAEYWLKLDPVSFPALQLLLHARVHQGDREGGQQILQKIRKLRPRQLPQVEEWFRRNAG
jgi:tetratricopeptide (TPR) repeat protein